MAGLALVLVFLAVAFTPLPNLLAGLLIVPSRIEAAEAIVVLGGGIVDARTLSPASLRRTVEGIRLYRQGLAPIIIFSGGNAGQEASEGALMASLAGELGVPSTAIWVEAVSNDTWTQAQEVGRLARPKEIRRILLVTDSFHMKRAHAPFERVGFRVLPASSGTAAGAEKKPEARLELMRRVCQEAVARLYYWIRGKL
jgi:uncharacterized SAM-binding protein YcdF (DUF218 family)